MKRKHLGITEETKIALAGFWEKYRAWAAVNKAEKSFVRDGFSFQHLLKAFPDNLQDITAKRIEESMVKRRENVGPATTNRERALLSHMFTKAVEWGYVSRDPTKQVKKLREPQGRLRFLTPEEFGRLIINAAPHLRPIIYTGVNTGMRVETILKMTWDQVDFTRPTITIPKTKNRERKILPMTNQLMKVLKEIPRHIDSSYVFCDAVGKPYKRIVKGFRAACKRAGIQDFTFHDLRHTFGSHLIMQGVDIRTVQELLGHKTIAMTMRYTHLTQTHLQQAIGILGKVFDPASEETAGTT